MSDLGWFGVFGVILLLMALVSAWMVWFSRRAMRSHKGQIEEMVEEMRDVIKEERREPSDEDGSGSG